MGVGDPKRKPRKLPNEKPDIQPLEDDVPLAGGNRGDSGGNDPPKKTGGNGDRDGEDGSQRSPKTTPAGRPLTGHAMDSLRRHGMTPAQVDEVISSYSHLIAQDDGATVYIQKQVGRGRKYSIVVLGEEGVVTAMRDLSEKGLAGLARNYGWSLSWIG